MKPLVLPSQSPMRWVGGPAEGAGRGPGGTLPGIFAPRRLTTTQLINQQQTLETSLAAEMAAASAQLAPEERPAFTARMAGMVNDVLADSMYPVHSAMINDPAHTVRGEAFEAAAEQARARAISHQQVALALQPMHAGVPQVQMLDSGQILLLRPAPAIETLVLGGGGARGAALAPALRALENLGLLTQVKQVVGSSVGAMAASLLAAGISSKDFQRILNGMDMLSLLSTPPGFAQRYPQVRLGATGFDAGTLLQDIDRKVGASVAQYLQQDWAQITRAPQWAQLTPAQQQRLELLRAPDFEAPRTGKMLTFADLHLLRQLAPTRFKDLVVTGWNQTQQRTAYFSHETTPDMAVALAGRISAGIPVLFADVKLQAEGQTQHWTDGGVGSNMPSEAVFQGLDAKALEEARARTLLMAFEGHGKVYDIMHGPPAQRSEAPHFLVTWLSGNPNFAQHSSADRHKIYEAGLLAMPVFHGDLKIGSFHASPGSVEQAKAQALEQALAHIEQTRHNYRHDVVDDVHAAAALLSRAEQDLFVARHGGDASPLQASLVAAITQQRAAELAVTERAQKAAALAWASREPMRMPA